MAAARPEARDGSLYRDPRGGRQACAGFPGPYWRRARPGDGLPDRVRERAHRERIPLGPDSGGIWRLRPAALGRRRDPGGGPAAGCNGGACHAQMYTMGTLLRHGSEAQKATYLPAIAEGRLRLQAFGVTEPTSGTDTGSLKTTARREGDQYVVNGQKIWTSRAEHSDLMLLLARTTPRPRHEAHRRPVGAARGHAGGNRQRPDHPADPHHDETTPPRRCSSTTSGFRPRT